VDLARPHFNAIFIGPEDWAARAYDEVETMRVENHRLKLEGLRRRRRKVELKTCIAVGPADP
jgi:hypothetical protein